MLKKTFIMEFLIYLFIIRNLFCLCRNIIVYAEGAG